MNRLTTDGATLNFGGFDISVGTLEETETITINGWWFSGVNLAD